jgi:hypothetical protein
MDRKDFQLLAVRTESVKDVLTLRAVDREIFFTSLQILDFIVEILDRYKKHIFYGRELPYVDDMSSLATSTTRLSNELGYLIAAASRSSETETEELVINPRVFHALLGTITEHGELAAALLKGLQREEGLDYINVLEELGDSDWYKALFYEATGVDWETVQAAIIKKLEIRFEDVIFGEDGANDRDLEAERAELERLLQSQLDLFEG